MMNNSTGDELLQILGLGKLFLSAFKSQPVTQLKSKNILIGAMGGSAIGGEYLQWISNWFNTDLTIKICRDYSLPKFVDSKWTILIVSYSGNTNETYSLLQQAHENKNDILTVSSGGLILEFCKKNNITHFSLESGFQPRFAFPLMLGKLTKLLFSHVYTIDDLENQFTCMEDPEFEFPSLINDLASDKNVLPIILTTTSFKHVGDRFRCQLNENSKKWAFAFSLPEFNHNGIVPLDSKDHYNMHFIFIYSKNEHQKLLHHIDFLKLMLKEKGIPFTELIQSMEDPLIDSLIITQKIDYISYQIALQQKISPIDVLPIDRLKSYLKDIQKN